MKFKQILSFLVILIILALVIFTGQAPEAKSDMRFLMNTLISIKVFAKAEQAQKALETGFSVFADIERISSFHLSDSETTRLNQQGNIKPSPLMAQLLQHAAVAVEKTQGYFDPTFAVLQQAYGFYHPDKTGRLPDTAEIETLLEKTGFAGKVSLGEDGSAAIASGTLLDFGGIAGGFAVQLAADAIRASGASCFLIDDAGDIWFEGKKPDGRPWKIAVRDPRQGQEAPLALIESFEPTAVSTSGNYERFVMVGERKLGHIMDPFNGRPVDYYQSVTVVASNPVDADVFSTAIYAMPESKAREWSEARQIPTLFLTSDNRVIVNKAGEKWFKAVKK